MAAGIERQPLDLDDQSGAFDHTVTSTPWSLFLRQWDNYGFVTIVSKCESEVHGPENLLHKATFDFG